MFKGLKTMGALMTLATTLTFAASDFNAFTGKVLGQHVRLRLAPDLESHVAKELKKNELIVITGQKGDFYQVTPLKDMKAYIFRSFVLDNVVEGNRVNVRLAPDLEAPVISHLSTGTMIDGKICGKNTKWLEIAPPSNTHFYVAKEYIEYAGAPELKDTMDKRESAVAQLAETAEHMRQAEMCKSFEAVDRSRVEKLYQQIISDYADFPEHVAKAKTDMGSFTDAYLQKKIAYLENRTAQLTKQVMKEEVIDLADVKEMSMTPTERMKAWEHVEESLYASWSAMHHAKTIDDYYSEQKLTASTVSGVLEAYPDLVKNKPGEFVLKEKDMPVAYVYSTHVNLHNLIGKRVHLQVAPRPNNDFAFPAYYVLNAE